MEHITTDARFLFWDGKTQFTVEYGYGVQTWYVFKGEETRVCLYKKEDKRINWKNVNKYQAEDILRKYLETIKG